MKTLFTFSFILFLALSSFSQRTPESFLARMPAPPAEACTISKENRDNFSSKFGEVNEQLTEQIKTRKEEYAKFAGNNKEKMLQNMAGQTGLSAAETAKLQSGGQLTEAEGMALANKMMGQKYNMSVGEAQKLGKMSETGQKAWAEGYGAEAVADAQANPDKYKRGQAKDKGMFELAAEQSKLASQIQAEEAKDQTQLAEFNSKVQIERKKLDEQLAPLEEEARTINDGEGSTEADVAHSYALNMKRYNLELKYCELMTPLYIDFLNRCLVSVKANLPARYRLQEVTVELNTAQNGVKIEGIPPDMMALVSITNYMTLLDDVFRFAPMGKPTR